MAAPTDFTSEFTPRAWKNFLFELVPRQGRWTEEQYLAMTDYTSRLIEFTDGCLEPLPIPTDRHQSILEYLYKMFDRYLEPRGGKVHMAALRLRIRADKFREPDLLLVRSAKDPRRQNRYWTGADLTLEVVSRDKPGRDLIGKRGDYAEGGVPEYWIVNPQDETILVLTLDDNKYVETGVFRRGQSAASKLLDGFAVDVNAVFDVD